MLLMLWEYLFLDLLCYKDFCLSLELRSSSADLSELLLGFVLRVSSLCCPFLRLVLLRGVLPLLSRRGGLTCPKRRARVPMSHKWKATIMGLQFDVTGVENASLTGHVVIIPPFSGCSRGPTGQPPSNPACPLGQSRSDTAGRQAICLEPSDDISKPFPLWAQQSDVRWDPSH